MCEPLPRPATRAGRKIRQLGQYSLDGRLGRGTFGRVYKAHGPQGLVALKVQTITAENMTALSNEVKVQQKIQHPSFVRLYESFTSRYHRRNGTDNVFCIVQELCEGGDLAWVMRQLCLEGGEIPAEYRARWLVQAVEGLTYLSKQNIVHRDIKPANCLIDGRGNLRIADLGTARSLLHTMQATPAGSPLYMAPEIDLRVPQSLYGPSVDVWSLGMMLLEVLLSRPHEPLSRAEYIYLQSRSDAWPAFLEAETRALSPDLVAFLTACLQFSPKARLSPDQLAGQVAVRSWSLCFGLDDPAGPPAPPSLLASRDLLPALYYALDAATPEVNAWACHVACIAYPHNPLLPGYLALDQLSARLAALHSPEADALRALVAGGPPVPGAPPLPPQPLIASFARPQPDSLPPPALLPTPVYRWEGGAPAPATAALLDLVGQQGLPVTALLVLEGEAVVAYDLAAQQRVELQAGQRQALDAATELRPAQALPAGPPSLWRVRPTGSALWDYLPLDQARLLDILYRACAQGVLLDNRLYRFDTGLGLDTSTTPPNPFTLEREAA